MVWLRSVYWALTFDMCLTCREVTSPITMELEESPSMATSLLMRTSPWSTEVQAPCPWPTPVQTPTGPSSSSALPKRAGESTRPQTVAWQCLCVNLHVHKIITYLHTRWEKNLKPEYPELKLKYGTFRHLNKFLVNFILRGKQMLNTALTDWRHLQCLLVSFGDSNWRMRPNSQTDGTLLVFCIQNVKLIQ